MIDLGPPKKLSKNGISTRSFANDRLARTVCLEAHFPVKIVIISQTLSGPNCDNFLPLRLVHLRLPLYHSSVPHRCHRSSRVLVVASLYYLSVTSYSCCFLCSCYPLFSLHLAILYSFRSPLSLYPFSPLSLLLFFFSILPFGADL